ncbi:MAG: PEP-CTERM sorting domain-containing protein [Proteobacteria bacterium]|nr:PEP-CTERM sorting domain-containing protein [Pseudomonadota bacterium]
MTSRPYQRGIAAAVLGAAAFAAQAETLATVDTRTSLTRVDYFGGFAIAGDSGSDGPDTPVTSFDPTDLAIGSTHTFVGSYLSWSVTYTVNWDLAQTYALDADAHTISGSGNLHLDESSAVVGPGCAPCAATVSITGSNTQSLEFALTDATPFQFHSDTTLGQWVELDTWSDLAHRWLPVWIGALETQGVVFDRDGTLAAGRYRIENNTGSFTADGVPPTQDNAWSYTLTLPDAAIAAVPEPATAALWALGAVALYAGRRRQRADTSR